MAERRLPFAVQDDEGVSRRGEVVIVPAWRDDVAPSPDAAFTIVLSERPLTNGTRIRTPGLALCAPAEPTRLGPRIGEGRVAYATNGAPPPIRLPRRALDSYAVGVVLAAHPLTITAREVFASNGKADLESLARALLIDGRTADRSWRALDAVLSFPNEPSKLARPDALRVRLRRLLKQIDSAPAYAADAIERLRAIADGAEPNAVETPASLAEDAALARCIIEHAEGARELAGLRTYLAGAQPGTQQDELIVDHASTRERLSFVALLSEPHSLGGMRAAFESFRAAYTRAYVEHHASYVRATTQLQRAIDDAKPFAVALERLNMLRGLGRAAGGAALREYASLGREIAPCTRTDLIELLHHTPRCSDCNVALGDETPQEQAQEIVRRLRRALERQQARLATETIRRILARGGERIEQFLQIVQASDQAGLVRVLDDELIAFLQDLLDQPVSITTDAVQLIDAFARAHPVVRPDDVDAAAETMRTLLSERASSQGEVRLANEST